MLNVLLNCFSCIALFPTSCRIFKIANVFHSLYLSQSMAARSTSGAQLPTGVSPLLLSMTWRNLQRLSVGGWPSPSVAILWHSWDLPTRYNPETGFCLRAMWQTKSLSSFREDDLSNTRWVSGHLRSSARTSSWKGQCSSHCCGHRSRQHE